MAKLRSDNVRAAGAMTLASAVFVLNDATMKYVAQSMPILQAMSVRGIAVSLGLAFLAWRTGAFAYLPLLTNRLVWVRAAAETIGSFAFMSALPFVPLGIVTALAMATPLFVLPFAVLLLGEKIGLRRALALFAGFAGVLLIVRPAADGVDGWVLLASGSIVFFALRDIATRRIPAALPSYLVALALAMTVACATTFWSLLAGWQPMTPEAFGGACLSALFVGIGYMMMVKATRIGEVAVTSGFRYSALVFAIALGWLLWGEMPDALAWAGIALILGSGIYALNRERLRARLSAKADAPQASD
jgi:drug/metabolite transporter (DMT)-like permease